MPVWSSKHLLSYGWIVGRLYQVEYAMEAIGHAGTCLGILASDGIVLAAEKRNTNKLLDELSYSEKIYRLHELVVCILYHSVRILCNDSYISNLWTCAKITGRAVTREEGICCRTLVLVTRSADFWLLAVQPFGQCGCRIMRWSPRVYTTLVNRHCNPHTADVWQRTAVKEKWWVEGWYVELLSFLQCGLSTYSCGLLSVGASVLHSIHNYHLFPRSFNF